MKYYSAWAKKGNLLLQEKDGPAEHSAKWNVRQKNKVLLYRYMLTENILMAAKCRWFPEEGWVGEEVIWVKSVKKYKLTVIKINNRVIAYSMLPVVNNNALHIWKLLGE